MVQIVFEEADGKRTQVDATVGHSLMEVAIANNISGIVAECAGSLACATCHVFLDQAQSERLGQPEGAEEEMLEFAAVERRDSSRLSCQVVVDAEMEGCVVTLPDHQH